jgi:hypothetical protein
MRRDLPGGGNTGNILDSKDDKASCNGYKLTTYTSVDSQKNLFQQIFSSNRISYFSYF